jgi:uncharacterized protein (DUF58 family)
MGVPAAGQKYIMSCDLALALAYVVLANADAVKLHALAAIPNQDRQATPFFRGRQRMFDLVSFLAARTPTGKVEAPMALAHHLQNVRRPGKAIWISDFLILPAAYQAGLRLLQAANLDLAVIQVLGKEELDPPLLSSGARFVDSESGQSTLVRFDATAKKEYLQRFELHNRTLRSFCHRTGVHYALCHTGLDLQTFILRELPALGLLS